MHYPEAIGLHICAALTVLNHLSATAKGLWEMAILLTLGCIYIQELIFVTITHLKY